MYAIPIKIICQPKHQVRHLNQNVHFSPQYRFLLFCCEALQLLMQIYTLFRVQFVALKIALAYQKWQITCIVWFRACEKCISASVVQVDVAESAEGALGVLSRS